MQTTQSQRNRVRKLAMAGAAAVLAAGAIVAASYAAAAEDADDLAAAQRSSADAPAARTPASAQAPAKAPAVTTAATPPPSKGFPANAKFDYQISEAYKPPKGVKVVSRDYIEKPAASVYNICYINGFQSQPDGAGAAEGTSAWFTANKPNLLLKNPTPRTPTRIGDKYAKQYYVDPGWVGEIMFDLRKPANLTELAGIVGKQIDRCSTSKFDAVEIDNLDTFTRALASEKDRKAAARAAQKDEDFDSSGKALLFTEKQALAYADLLIKKAHSLGLKVAQKNTAELGDAGKAKGFDFAVVEGCGSTEECGDYAGVWRNQWVDIEYDDEGFAAACDAVKKKISVVRRDLEVSSPTGSDYEYDEC